MTAPLPTRYLPVAQTALRVMAGAAFFSHGAAKLFGWFGADSTVELMSKFGVAGVIETFGGLLLIIGLGTRLVAFIASGEMAVAYFMMHAMGSESIWWWQNRGETVMLFCFIWLLFAAWGAGPYSLDARLARRRTDG